MMIQQNVITSHTQPVEVHKARIRHRDTLIAIMLILGVTLMLSLYVYQASVLYATRLSIESARQDYARQERLNAESLAFYAQTQSMEAMVRRARASGYGPPQASQIKYVRFDDGGPAFVQTDNSREVATRQ
jgi:hypothetical protein